VSAAAYYPVTVVKRAVSHQVSAFAGVNCQWLTATNQNSTGVRINGEHLLQHLLRF
jgi:hypothetical protein